MLIYKEKHVADMLGILAPNLSTDSFILVPQFLVVETRWVKLNGMIKGYLNW